MFGRKLRSEMVVSGDEAGASQVAGEPQGPSQDREPLADDWTHGYQHQASEGLINEPAANAGSQGLWSALARLAMNPTCRTELTASSQALHRSLWLSK